MSKQVTDSGLWCEKERTLLLFNLSRIANHAKYTQHPRLMKLLKGTRDCLLVETIGPHGSRFWSSGLSFEQLNSQLKDHRGLNVGGFGLTSLRDELLEEDRMRGHLQTPTRKRNQDGSDSDSDYLSPSNVVSETVFTNRSRSAAKAARKVTEVSSNEQ